MVGGGDFMGIGLISARAVYVPIVIVCCRLGGNVFVCMVRVV